MDEVGYFYQYKTSWYSKYLGVIVLTFKVTGMYDVWLCFSFIYL